MSYSLHARSLLLIGLLALAQVCLPRCSEAQTNAGSQFDPSAFQNRAAMSALYSNSTLPDDGLLWILYARKFALELRNSSCRARFKASTLAAIEGSLGRFGGEFYDLSTQTPEKIPAAEGNGVDDADTLVDRYGCQSDVTNTILDNLDARFGVRGARRNGGQ